MSVQRQHLGPAFSDDFESNVLLVSSGGKWDVVGTQPSVTASTTTLAAHQGTYGFRVVDSNTTATTGRKEGYARHDLSGGGTAGDYFARYWFRVVATNSTGSNIASAFETASSFDALDFHVSHSASNYFAAGYNSVFAHTQDTFQTLFATNTWHLVEVAVLGSGTSTASRKLWVDGVLKTSSANYDATGLVIAAESLGEPWTDDGVFSGTYDFDDFRSGYAPHGSKLSVSIATSISANVCISATVSLRDSSNVLADAPYGFSGALSSSGVTGGFFSDSGCNSSTTTASFAVSAQTATVYYRATTAGTATLTASFADFLTGSTTSSVSIDGTAPIAGTVSDGSGADIDSQASTTGLSANWSGFSDSESGIAGYEWAIGTTPGGVQVQAFTSVGSATSATASLQLFDGVTYYVSIRATNNAGGQTIATSDGVLAQALAVSASILGVPSSVVVGQAVSFVVELRDSLGNLATGYRGRVSFSSTDGASTLPAAYTFTGADAGSHTFTNAVTFGTVGQQSLTVTDAALASLTSTQAGITVTQNLPPTIVHEAQLRAAVGVRYVYSALGNARASGTSPFSFSSCGSPSGFWVDATSGAIGWTPTAAGAVNICIQASNFVGTDTYNFSVTVDPGPAATAPIASFFATPSEGAAPLATQLDASASTADPTAMPLQYRWQFGDGSPTAAGQVTTQTYRVPGAYRPKLTVFDAVGDSAESKRDVVVLDENGRRPPMARIITSTLRGQDSLGVSFTSEVTNGSGQVIFVHWDLGNGLSASGLSAEATYGPGRYHARLTVLDDTGLTGTDEAEIVVTQGAAEPPFCRATATVSGAAPATVTYAAEYAPGSSPISSFLWDLGEGDTESSPRFTRSLAQAESPSARLVVEDSAGLKCTDSLYVNVLTAQSRVAPRLLTLASLGAQCGVNAPNATRVPAAGGGPLRFSLVNAPTGLSIDEGTGTLTWPSPTAISGPQVVRVRVQNDAGSDEGDFTLEVDCERQSFSVGCGCNAGQHSPLEILILFAGVSLRARSRGRTCSTVSSPSSLHEATSRELRPE